MSFAALVYMQMDLSIEYTEFYLNQQVILLVTVIGVFPFVHNCPWEGDRWFALFTYPNCGSGYENSYELLLSSPCKGARVWEKN